MEPTSGTRVFFRPDPSRRAHLLAELRRMVGILRRTPGVRKAVLCGSLAENRVGVASDIDLLVVREGRGHFLDRSADLVRSLRPRTALDLLVYTPSEFDRMTKEGNRFLRHALSRGKVLFERGPSRRK